MSSIQSEVAQLLKSGDLLNARSVIKSSIRAAATDADLRFMLFQIQALIGEWESSADQLRAYYELTGRHSTLAFVFNEVLQGEVVRKRVFSGQESPVIFGEPPKWLCFWIKALAHSAKGEWDAAKTLRSKALEQVPPIAGSLNGRPFDWIMDGDSRVGPVIEVIIKGQYYWMPQSRLRRVSMPLPEQIRDAVWSPALMELETGATISAFVPVRYPGEANWKDDALRLARKTEWHQPSEGTYIGAGQRIFMTDSGENAFLEVRKLEFNSH